MRRTSVGLLSLALATGVGVTIGAPSVGAAPTVAPAVKAADQQPQSSDELSSPPETKRRALKEEALKEVISGKVKPEKVGKSTVAKLAKGKGGGGSDEYVELSREGTDKIFVILTDFGNERDPRYPDRDTDPNTPGPVLFDGPLNNQIPQPDRSVDNSTNWNANYSREYFQNLYFGDGGTIGEGGTQETVKEWYERQSSGRYSIDGTVSDWVKVRYNQARYGRSNGSPCASNVCTNTWALVNDAANVWYNDQIAKGRPKAEVIADLKSYDQWDRYDYDGDGNFNEPDGYIDHFQIVHAGGDQADGDPYYGEDAIWSHRWYVNQIFNGTVGPAFNPFGGFQIGDSGVWIGDYTIQPENGGMSVFTHEYGHDLGLPDLYDTTTGADNGVNWWSMMSQSRQAGPNDQSIGSRGSDFGAWEKLMLGWLDYDVVVPNARPVKTELGPHEYNSAKKQAAIVVLPDKTVTTDLVALAVGSKSWWSGRGNSFTHTLSREVTLGQGAATLTFQANWDIEDCGPDPCDYAYVEVKDGSAPWTVLAGSITKPSEGNGIDGMSSGWVPATFDLSAYAGKTVGLRFRYTTDPAAGGKGFFADDVKLVSGGSTVFQSGAESGAEGWTADGFSAVGATIEADYPNYYIASHRDYVSFDKYLQSGPYNFGWLNSKPDLVEHFPYQDGLLISYWDLSQSNNNTGDHPGEGLILPVDANPTPVKLADGTFLRARVAGYDAPFSKEKSDSFVYHKNGVGYPVNGAVSRPLFADNAQFWFADTPYTGVKVPNNGVNVLVESQSGTSMTIKTWLR
ncbi:immune inhibitor A domain-containing protein [Intrasporangium mesophilum]